MTPTATNLSVFIADDHEDARQDIRTLVERQRGWKVCGESTTGGETIELVSKLRPDMLFLDLTLPDMNTVETITGITEVCPTVKIVVLAISDLGEWAVKALIAGASGVVMKSDVARDLIPTVQEIRQSRSFLSPLAERNLKKYFRKEMKKMILERAAINKAIADFERLEAKSLAKIAAPGSGANSKLGNLIEMNGRNRTTTAG